MRNSPTIFTRLKEETNAYLWKLSLRLNLFPFQLPASKQYGHDTLAFSSCIDDICLRSAFSRGKTFLQPSCGHDKSMPIMPPTAAVGDSISGSGVCSGVGTSDGTDSGILKVSFSVARLSGIANITPTTPSTAEAGHSISRSGVCSGVRISDGADVVISDCTDRNSISIVSYTKPKPGICIWVLKSGEKSGESTVHDIVGISRSGSGPSNRSLGLQVSGTGTEVSDLNSSSWNGGIDGNDSKW